MLNKHFRPATLRGLPVFFFLLFLSSLSAQTIDSAVIHYQQINRTGDDSLTLTATAYYQRAPRNFLMKVTEPLQQTIIEQNDKTIFYFPEDNNGFSNPSNPEKQGSVSREILTLLLKDKGLSGQGFELVRIKPLSSALLEVRWEPKVKINNPLAIKWVQVITNLQEEIQEIRGYGNEDTVFFEAQYSDYTQSGKISYPQRVLLHQNSPQGEQMMEIEIRISQAEINQGIPQEILEFTIPDNAEILSLGN